MHPCRQLGPAPADHLTSDSVVVDVCVCDDQPGELIERAAARGKRGGQCPVPSSTSPTLSDALA
jgi:hypothetical protein